MEDKLLELVLGGGDTAILLFIMVWGWGRFKDALTNEVHSIDTRLTVIEALLKERRDQHRQADESK